MEALALVFLSLGEPVLDNAEPRRFVPLVPSILRPLLNSANGPSSLNDGEGDLFFFWDEPPAFLGILNFLTGLSLASRGLGVLEGDRSILTFFDDDEDSFFLLFDDLDDDEDPLRLDEEEEEEEDEDDDDFFGDFSSDRLAFRGAIDPLKSFRI